MGTLDLESADDAGIAPISPWREMGAYEALWLQEGATFKRLSERFNADVRARPSDFIPAAEADRAAEQARMILQKKGVERFGIRVNKAGDYPPRLRDAKYPVELLYYQGDWELTEMRGLAIVGSRKATEDGKRRAARLSRELVDAGFAIYSGLASGIDISAHRAAIDAGGQTIAVIGTPLGENYPKENRDTQNEIAANHLLISQVPILRYEVQPFPQKRLYFPERNATMSALSEATIIVEAGETSGTLTQARAALFQGRKLFILNNCFFNSQITWPARFEKEGAVRVSSIKDILDRL